MEYFEPKELAVLGELYKSAMSAGRTARELVEGTADDKPGPSGPEPYELLRSVLGNDPALMDALQCVVSDACLLATGNNMDIFDSPDIDTGLHLGIVDMDTMSEVITTDSYYGAFWAYALDRLESGPGSDHTAVEPAVPAATDETPRAPSPGERLLATLAAGDEDASLEMIRAQPALINWEDSDGRSALHWAVVKRLHVLLKELLDMGADTEHRNLAGDTPLHTAAELKNTEATRILLESGADVHALGGDYMKYTALSVAAEKGAVEIMEILVAKGADVRALDVNNSTPLHAAVGSGNLAAVELLIKNGADVNAKSKIGRTPLHQAVWKGLEITRLLLENGADPDAKDCSGQTPASHLNDTAALKLLDEYRSHSPWWKRLGK